MYDAIVIGGGFYGCSVAAHLSRKPGFKKVLLIEREKELMSRASLNNQARLHNGYHYPRSLATARRSRVNMPKFMRDWDFGNSIRRDVTMIYAIAKRGSKTSFPQFESFCKKVGASLKTATLGGLLSMKAIDKAYFCDEIFFNTDALRCLVKMQLDKSDKVEVRKSDIVYQVERHNDIALRVWDSDTYETATYVFNCTYSGLNQIQDTPSSRALLKHELTEMVLLKCPDELQGIGITVMDGPFFSLVPSMTHPGLHNLAHVRYTVHQHWLDKPGRNPYAVLERTPRDSRAGSMIADAARFVPAIAKAKYVNSIWEIKTVLAKNEQDDGRPVHCERYRSMPGYFTILGSKIDHVYDALDQVDRWVG